MTSPKNHVLSLLMLTALAACRTTTDGPKPAEATSTATSEGPAAPALPKPAAGPALALATPAPECPVRDDGACPHDGIRTVCMADAYKGATLPGPARLAVWGANGCLARRQLARAACAANMLPSRLGPASCVADATGGACPPAPVPCASGQGQPTLCTAGYYGRTALTGEATLSGSGATECAASANLTLAACRQNLNPRLLRGIICHADPTAGECPPREPACTEKPRGATCTARKLEGKALNPPLEAKGPTGCAAKLELARLACERLARPSTLDNITCVFGR